MGVMSPLLQRYLWQKQWSLVTMVTVTKHTDTTTSSLCYNSNIAESFICNDQNLVADQNWMLVLPTRCSFTHCVRTKDILNCKRYTDIDFTISLCLIMASADCYFQSLAKSFNDCHAVYANLAFPVIFTLRKQQFLKRVHCLSRAP